LSPFMITFGAGAPGYFNHTYARTPIGHLLPSLSGYMLTASLASMGVMVIMDYQLKPAAPETHAFSGLLRLAEWCLMPAVGIALSALPGLVAHTRLLFGRYLEYKVTEKLAPSVVEPRSALQMEAVPVSTQ
jgi:hypothetical protein